MGNHKQSKMNKKRYLPFVLMLSFGFCNSQTRYGTLLEKSVDSLINIQIKPNEPGISVLIAQHGQIIYKKAFGSANLEFNLPLRPDMIFKMGSVTKQLIAVGILQLAEQGKISLKDSIQKFIKDFPLKDYTITIEHLLTHTSGIRDYSNADTTHNLYIERHEFTPIVMIMERK